LRSMFSFQRTIGVARLHRFPAQGLHLTASRAFLQPSIFTRFDKIRDAPTSSGFWQTVLVSATGIRIYHDSLMYRNSPFYSIP
ncbi:hypothetical protein, partial [Cohnella hongkongensis]